jgi:large subunit ribosomal protein L7/L12
MSPIGDFFRDFLSMRAAESAKQPTSASWTDNHGRSEKLAAEASILARQGRALEAEATYLRAAEFEEAALAALSPDKARTLGITAVSAVALRLKGNDLAEAASLANRELAKGRLPAFAVEQLRDLLTQVAEKRVAAVAVYETGAMVSQVESPYDLGYDPPPDAAVEAAGFTVTLTGIGRNKIDVIKVIREVTGLGLKEAKELVESAPVVVKADANKVEAAEINAKIRAAGAVAVVK